MTENAEVNNSIDQTLPNDVLEKPKSEHNILRGYVNMFVTLSSIYALQNDWFRYYLAVVMASYMIYGSSFIHHAFVLTNIGFKLIFASNDDRPDNTVVYFTRCEYSTIFYSGKIIVCDLIERSKSNKLKKIEPIIKNAFDLAFLVSFVKVRIIDLGRFVVFNPTTYSWHQDLMGNRTTLYLGYNLSIWGFYALNIYWLMTILRKSYKQLVVKYNSYLICEYICQYSLFLSYVVCAYVYKNNNFTEIPAIIDMCCVAFLSYTSYDFHHFLYNELRLTGESFDSLTDGSQLMINDAIGVNVCAFGSFVSTVWSYYPSSPKFILRCVLFLVWLNISFGWLTIRHIKSMKTNGDQLRFNQESPKRIYLYILINLPGLTAVVMNLLIEKDYRSYTDLMILIAKHSMCIWASWAVVKISPFYKLNHIATHIIAAAHHYCIANQIVSGSIIRN